LNNSEQRDIVSGFLVGFLATAGISCVPQLFFVSDGIELGSLMGGLMLSVIIGGLGAAIAAGFHAIGAAMRTDSKHDRPHRLYTDPPESEEPDKRPPAPPAEPKSMEDKLALIRRMTQSPASDKK
jgi:hypothetical protein